MSGQYDRVVQPGQSGKIPVKISTGHGTGPISKGITIVTNVAGTGATVNLQIKGELWQIMQATPTNALFGNVTAAQSKEGPVIRKVTIANNGESLAKLGEVKSSNPAFKAEVKDLEPGKKWELSITLATPQPPGVQSGTVELTTGMAEVPKLQIACSAYIVADVDVVPSKMMIPGTRTVSLQRDFYVRNNSLKPLHISELAATNPLIKLGLQETQTGVAFRITMDVPPEYKIPKEGDKLTFKTDNPNHASMAIAITEAPAAPPAPPANPAAVGPTVPGKVPVVQSKLHPAARDKAGFTPPHLLQQRPAAAPSAQPAAPAAATPAQPPAPAAAANPAPPVPQPAVKPAGQ